MNPRQSLIELFSTFIQFQEDYFHGWVSDGKLRHNMQGYLNQFADEKTTERFWVIFWHKQWAIESSSLARNHLCAYLQEVCYWTTQKTLTCTQSSRYKLSDGFQIAISDMDKILKGFNPEQGTSLKTYASVMFRSFLTNFLRQYSAIDVSTDWALLRKLSKKRLGNALKKVGLSEKERESYLLAWICFKTIYSPSQQKITQKLPPPNQATYEDIKQLYQSESLNQLGKKDTKITAGKLEEILKLCAKYARSYLYPQTTSLNVTPLGHDSGEIIDNLPSPNPNQMMEIIAQEEALERKQKQKNIQTVLVRAVKELKSEMQNILKLYFEEGLNQQQIAQRLDTKQYTISRRLTRARELLIKALAVWSQNTLQQTLNAEKLKQMSCFVDEWLYQHYQNDYP